jgi:hypothetical protein
MGCHERRDQLLGAGGCKVRDFSTSHVLNVREFGVGTWIYVEKDISHLVGVS